MWTDQSHCVPFWGHRCLLFKVVFFGGNYSVCFSQVSVRTGLTINHVCNYVIVKCTCVDKYSYSL